MFSDSSKGVNVQATKCLREVSWHTMCKHTRTYLAHAKGTTAPHGAGTHICKNLKISAGYRNR